MTVSMRDLDGASSAELVDLVSDIAHALAGRPASCSAARCMEEAEVLGRATDLLEAAIAARVAIADRTGSPRAAGHTSTSAWLRNELNMRGGRARERRTLATQLERLPGVAHRLRSGDLSLDYASVIASAVTGLSDEDCRKAEEILLGAIDDQECTIAEVQALAHRLKDIIAERDGKDAPPDDARRGRRSWWQLSASGDGAFIRGWFDSELRALVKAKLGPLAKPTGADDPRDHPQRMADALASFLSGGGGGFDPIVVIRLEDGTEPQKAPARHKPQPSDPQPSVKGASPAASDADRAAGGAGPVPDEADPRHPTGPGRSASLSVPVRPRTRDGRVAEPSTARPDPTASRAPGGPGHPAEPAGPADPAEPTSPEESGPPAESAAHSEPICAAAERANDPPSTRPWDFGREELLLHGGLRARLADGTPINPARARQILLAAGFSALVIGSDGHPLYLGRRTRFATHHQRRVLNARYRTCVVRGCEIPAELCEIDHVDGWFPNGTTDIDLLVPCCSFHNRWKSQHPRRIAIDLRADGLYRYRIIRPGTPSSPPDPSPLDPSEAGDSSGGGPPAGGRPHARA